MLTNFWYLYFYYVHQIHYLIVHNKLMTLSLKYLPFLSVLLLFQGVDVLILGILDCIPHRCICDQDFLENEFNQSLELESQISKFLCSALYLEWLSTMVSTALLPMQRSQGQSLITGERK